MSPPGRGQIRSADARAGLPGARRSTCVCSPGGGTGPAHPLQPRWSCDAPVHGAPAGHRPGRVERARRGESSAPSAGQRRGPRDACSSTPCPAQRGAAQRDGVAHAGPEAGRQHCWGQGGGGGGRVLATAAGERPRGRRRGSAGAPQDRALVPRGGVGTCARPFFGPCKFRVEGRSPGQPSAGGGPAAERQTGRRGTASAGHGLAGRRPGRVGQRNVTAAGGSRGRGSVPAEAPRVAVRRLQSGPGGCSRRRRCVADPLAEGGRHGFFLE